MAYEENNLTNFFQTFFEFLSNFAAANIMKGGRSGGAGGERRSSAPALVRYPTDEPNRPDSAASMMRANSSHQLIDFLLLLIMI